MSESCKVSEKEPLRLNAVTTGAPDSSTNSSTTSNTPLNRNFSSTNVASMPVIITSTKPSSLPTTTTCGGPVFSHRNGAQSGPVVTLSRSSSAPSTQMPLIVHTQTSSQSHLITSSSVGEMLPPQPTSVAQSVTQVPPVSAVNPPGSISYAAPPPPPQQGTPQPAPPPNMRSSFSMPLTRDQL